jgi:hypothetical protein
VAEEGDRRVVLGQILVVDAPLIVISEGDVMVFDDAAEAERWMEPIDVDDGLYRAWDRRGRRLEITLSKRTERRRTMPWAHSVEYVEIRPSPTPADAQSLAELEAELRRRLPTSLLPSDAPFDLEALVGRLPRWS